MVSNHHPELEIRGNGGTQWINLLELKKVILRRTNERMIERRLMFSRNAARGWYVRKERHRQTTDAFFRYVNLADRENQRNVYALSPLPIPTAANTTNQLITGSANIIANINNVIGIIHPATITIAIALRVSPSRLIRPKAILE